MLQISFPACHKRKLCISVVEVLACSKCSKFTGGKEVANNINLTLVSNSLLESFGELLF